VRYAGQGQEGTAPARAFVDFKTTVSPERIIDIYESRCRAIGLVPQRQPSKDNKLVLHCTNESTELGIGAIGTDNLTSVTVGGWQFEK
jgi:hypothetical protein